jgi:TolB protein
MNYMTSFSFYRKLASFLLLIVGSQSVMAQTPPPAPDTDEPELVEFDTSKTRSIAVPALVAPAPVDTPAGNSAALGRQIAEVISSNLRASGVFETQGPNGLRHLAWRSNGAPV